MILTENMTMNYLHELKNAVQGESNSVYDFTMVAELGSVREVLTTPQAEDAQVHSDVIDPIIQRIDIMEQRIGMIHAHHSRFQQRLRDRVDDLECLIKDLTKNSIKKLRTGQE